MGYTIASDPVGWMAALRQLQPDTVTTQLWLSGALSRKRRDADNCLQLRTLYRHSEAVEHWNGAYDLLVSDGRSALNDFPEEHGGKRKFEPPFLFDDCVGIATAVSHQLAWTRSGRRVGITSPANKIYAGFELPALSSQVLSIGSHNEPVARLLADGEISVWLTAVNEPQSETELLETVVALLRTPAYLHSEYRGVQVPLPDFNKSANLDWMSGLQSTTHIISEAQQQIELHLNEFGTHPKAAVDSSITGTSGDGPPPLVFDRPFLLFFALGGVPLPSCVCYIGTDSWQANK